MDQHELLPPQVFQKARPEGLNINRSGRSSNPPHQKTDPRDPEGQELDQILEKIYRKLSFNVPQHEPQSPLESGLFFYAEASPAPSRKMSVFNFDDFQQQDEDQAKQKRKYVSMEDLDRTTPQKVPPKNFKKANAPFPVPAHGIHNLRNKPAPAPTKIATFQEFQAAVLSSKNIGFRPFSILTKNPQEKWYYVDTHGVIQGGFSAEEMDAWYNLDYLPNELQVSYNDTVSFKSMKDHLRTAAEVSYSLYYGSSPKSGSLSDLSKPPGL